MMECLQHILMIIALSLGSASTNEFQWNHHDNSSSQDTGPSVDHYDVYHQVRPFPYHLPVNTHQQITPHNDTQIVQPPMASGCNKTNKCCDFDLLSTEFTKCIETLGCAPRCPENNSQPSSLLYYLLSPKCKRGGECCRYGILTSLFHRCCTRIGCCNFCGKHEEGCRNSRRCVKIKGVCKSSCSSTDSEIRIDKGGCGDKTNNCKCCKPSKVMPIGLCPNSTGQTECCQHEPGSEMFKKCCLIYGCCPICEVKGCKFGNTTYKAGTVVARYPGKCYELRCQLLEFPSEPYYTYSIVEYNHFNSSNCCSLGAKMYQNGDLLSDHEYCISVQCMKGNWINQGYINKHCRICRASTSMISFNTFNEKYFNYGDTQCRYSLTQDGSLEEPSHYIYLNMMYSNSSRTDLYSIKNIYFKDTEGTPEIICQVQNTSNVCSFGSLSSVPMEVNDEGTMAFTFTLGAVDQIVIMGTNKITIWFSNKTIFVLAPNRLHDKLGGLCGEYNGHIKDEVKTRLTLTSAKEHGASWVVKEDNCNATGSLLRNTEVNDSIKQTVQVDNGTDSMMGLIEENVCVSVLNETVMEYTGKCEMIIENMVKNREAEIGIVKISDQKYILDMCIQLMCLCQLEGCLETLNQTLSIELEVRARSRVPRDIQLLLPRPQC